MYKCFQKQDLVLITTASDQVDIHVSSTAGNFLLHVILK